ncbi:MAG: hypothetical protein ACM3NV_09160, partial [Syntrophothermus sp.]
VEAVCRFVEATGRRAAIGSLADAARVVAGEAGTQVVAAAGAGPAGAVGTDAGPAAPERRSALRR